MHLSPCNDVKKLNMETKKEVLWVWFWRTYHPELQTEDNYPKQMFGLSIKTAKVLAYKYMYLLLN